MAKIGLQLYTVREQLGGDFTGVIRQIAGMGYDGVEPARMYGGSAQEGADLFRSLNLAVPSAHLQLLDDADSRAKSLDDAATLGCKYVVVPFIPSDQFETVEAVEAHCERINLAAEAADTYSMKLLYHNHWWEFTPKQALGGRRPFDIMWEKLDPSVGFELDTFWAQHAGQDVAPILAQLGDRAPLIHIKDGHPGTQEKQLAVGDGDMDFAALLKGNKAEWWIAELDNHEGDMLNAVQRSVAYLRTLQG